MEESINKKLRIKMWIFVKITISWLYVTENMDFFKNM